MKTEIKLFNNLNVSELYAILNLRNQVFVVEQNCIYLDTDGNDTLAHHILIWNANELVAYARIFKPGLVYETSSIGRVVVNPAYRGKKIGHLLMQNATHAIKNLYKSNRITISAQSHLQKFYTAHGFKTISTPYLEDDIPHVKMIKE